MILDLDLNHQFIISLLLKIRFLNIYLKFMLLIMILVSNAELIYTLENDYDGLFRLDKTTGILTLNQALDYELHKFYQLKVEVHDKGVNSLSDTCMININVLDQNDHAPSIQMKFNPIFEHNQDGNMAYVKESFDINLPLVFVTVHDQDSGDHGKVNLILILSNLLNDCILLNFLFFFSVSINS